MNEGNMFREFLFSRFLIQFAKFAEIKPRENFYLYSMQQIIFSFDLFKPFIYLQHLMKNQANPNSANVEFKGRHH